MKFLAAICLLTSSFLATSAFAMVQSSSSSWYLGVSGDIDSPRSSTLTGTTDNGTVDYKSSKGGEVAIGYEPQSLASSIGDVRLEVEGGYHQFGLQDVVVDGVTNASTSGNLRVSTLMGNAYFDLHTGTGLTPYVGAGAGDAYINFGKNNGFGATDSNDNRLGYQLMGGVSYTMPILPKIDWSVGYRYLGTTGPEFTTATGDIKFDDLHSSDVEVGLKYHF